MIGARIAGALVDAGRGLAGLALPQRCPGCGAVASHETLLCRTCLAAIPRLSLALCAHCLARGREPVGCARHPGRSVWAAWVYDERTALVVHALKYAARPWLARGLGAELARAVPAAPRRDLVLEVPLHPTRRRERGYNQAACLADALGDVMGVPRLESAVVRSRATRPQARLDPAARRANVAGAFAVPRPQRLKGREVLIVDDVLTTGATLDACLSALERAGARPVGVALAWAQ